MPLDRASQGFKHIACLAIFFIALSATAQEPRISFNQLTTSSGLSNNQINSIFQDDLGYMWFGTLSGLNRYDGYEVRKFYHSERDSSSLINNTVLWMAHGPEEKIWVSTGEGVCAYDPVSENFSTVDRYLEILQAESTAISKLVRDASNSFWFSVQNKGVIKLQSDGQVIVFDDEQSHDKKITSNMVSDIYLDSSNHLWIIHELGGIQVIDTEKNRVTRMLKLPESLSEEEHNWWIVIDEEEDIWLHSNDGSVGILYMNTSSGSYKIIDDKLLPSDIITSVVQYDSSSMLVGTDHGGLSILNKRDWSVQTVTNSYLNPRSLSSNNVKNIFIDESKGVWVGTAKSGMNYYHQAANNFTHIRTPYQNPDYNDISSFSEDPSGDIYLGTNGAGVLRFNPEDNSFSRLSQNGSMTKVVVSLLHSKDGLWVGSYLEGLFQLKKGVLSKFEPLADQKDLSVWELFEDANGRIWIGTLGRGVFCYETDKNKITHYDDSNILNSNYVTCIEEDGQGHIWFGTGAGISVYNPQDGSYRQYSVSQGKEGISNNSINSLLYDSQGLMWIATLDGLNLYDFDANSIKVFRKEDGMSSDIVQSILEDDDRNFWASSSRGMTKIVREAASFTFQSFDTTDGLQGDFFTEDAGFKTSSGHLLFAGQNGFNMFKPENILEVKNSPKLIFTELHAGNTKVEAGMKYGGGIILENHINETEQIELNASHNSFTIGFTCLDFFRSSKVKYQYRLDGLDEEWNTTPQDNRQATYSNLPAGNYIFRVRSIIGNNVQEANSISLNITVNPPFWQTPLGYFIQVMGFLLLVVSIRIYIGRREQKKSEARHEKLEAERLHQMDLMKMRFFTNVSHEFRTPLSLVLTPLEQMVKKPESISSYDLKMVYRNAKRLMTMVNQLLDFRKMEANQHVLKTSNGDFVQFIKGIVESLYDLSKEKGIELNFVSNRDSFYMLFDRDKVEKIMFNLLSNAFKFTETSGVISVELIFIQKKDDAEVTLLVSDNGVGIPEEHHEQIFDRFFQTESSVSNLNNGTGIGLSITKEFAEMHGGSVSVDSDLGAGSTFMVRLPIEKYKDDSDGDDHSDKSEIPGELESQNDHSVLVVEDNFDFRNYLENSLSEFYNVQTASNGKEALKILRKATVDIVVTDVMMPEMDGYELCKKIKSDPRISFIPVILLTAQNSDEHQIEGLKAGAIEFISKPFNFEILISGIESALKFRNQVKDFEHMLKPELEEVDIVSQDKELLAKAVQFVEANISNSSLSVEDLSRELAYSRGHFYQKLLKITGQTPIDFIRDIRMKRASELLSKSELNVSEVAYKVGYNNPKLFSKYFKKKYNSYPSQYQAEYSKRT